MPRKTLTKKPTYYADGRSDDTTTLYFDRLPNGSIRSLGYGCTEAEARRRGKNPMSMIVTPAQLKMMVQNEDEAHLGEPSLTVAQAAELRENALFKVEMRDQFLLLNRVQFEAYKQFAAAQDALAAEQH